MLKAVYGIIKDDFLNMVKDLKFGVLQLKPCDPCGMNNTIEEYKNTLVLYVYIMNIYHMSSRVVDKMTEFLNIIHENILKKDIGETNIS